MIFGSSERSGAVVVVGFTLVVVAFGLAMVVDPVGHSGPTLAALRRWSAYIACLLNQTLMSGAPTPSIAGSESGQAGPTH